MQNNVLLLNQLEKSKQMIHYQAFESATNSTNNHTSATNSSKDSSELVLTCSLMEMQLRHSQTVDTVKSQGIPNWLEHLQQQQSQQQQQQQVHHVSYLMLQQVLGASAMDKSDHLNTLNQLHARLIDLLDNKVLKYFSLV
jgi:hypothetical protein